jgi:uncharacterized low-complexity protein
MSKTNSTPTSLALCTALVGGLALSGSAFAMQSLPQGYLLSASSADGEKAAEGKCGADKKAGEGKCGIEKVDTDKDGKVSRAEFTTAHADQADKFDAIDTNKDGFIDNAEHKAHAEGKCGEGKCGADKKAGDKKAEHAEGKCGEGKCGGSV